MYIRIGTNDYSHLENALHTVVRFSRTVSVVVPFYRNVSLLENTLTGLLAQTYPRELMEIVVSEDGDAGEAIDLVSRIRQYLTIRLIQHSRDGYRLCTARNNGIRSAQGEIIVLLDFDMIPLPSLIESHARWFHVSDEIATIGPRKFINAAGIIPADVLSHNSKLRNLPDVPSASNRFERYDNRLGQFVEIKSHPFPFNCFHGCNVAFLRSHALEIGLFDENFNGYCGYDDMEFGFRLWQRGNFLIYEPGALGLHQENDVVSFEKREESRERNLELLYRRTPPEYKMFRGTLGRE